MCDVLSGMRTSTALASTLLAGALIAGVAIVPAEAASDQISSDQTGARTCRFEAPGNVMLRVKLRLRAKHGDDLRAVRVRATDEDGHGRFRDHRVRVGDVRISIEHVPEHTGGGAISSAQAIRRHGSPVRWKLDPASSGKNVERVSTEVSFRLDGGRRVLATCNADLR